MPGEAPLVAGRARARRARCGASSSSAARLLPTTRSSRSPGRTARRRRASCSGAMLDAPVAGNVGRALCELDGVVAAGRVGRLRARRASSSRTSTRFRPRVAVLLNLEPDHLDRHGTFDAYPRREAPRVRESARGDIAVVPRGFGDVPGAARRVEFDRGRRAARRAAHPRARTTARTPPRRPRRRGLRDRRRRDRARRCATFPGVPHRLELVAERTACRFVNDSKATNVGGGRCARSRRTTAPAPADPRRSREGRVVRAARRAPRAGRSSGRSWSARRRRRARRGARRSVPLRARRRPRHGRSAARWRPRFRATSSCSRPRARATTSSRTSRSAGEQFRRLVRGL